MAGNIKGITIEIDGNTSKLTKALSGVNKDLKETNSNLKQVDKLLDIDPRNVELLEQKQRLLGKAVEDTKEKLDLLRTAQEQAAEALKDGDIGQDEYDALTREIIKTEQELGAYEEAAESAADALDMAQAEGELEAVEDGARATSGQMDELGTESSETGGLFADAWSKMSDTLLTLNLTDVIGGIANAAMEVGKKALEAAEEFDESMATMAQSTGATGEELRKMTKDAIRAYRAVSNANGSMEEASATFGELNTRFGLTGEEATEATEKVLNFAKVTGQDGASAVDLLADTIRKWGGDISDADALMDNLVYTAQQTGTSVTELGDALSDNAFQWKTLGYSQEEALELMGRVAWAGGDVSDVTRGMETAIKRLSGEVDDVPGTFKLALKELENWDGECDILQQTVGDTGLTIEDVFGTKVGQTMAGALSAASQNAADFSFSMEEASGRMQQTAEDSVTLKDKISDVGKTFEIAFAEEIDPSMEGIARASQEMQNKVAASNDNMKKDTVVKWTDMTSEMKSKMNEAKTEDSKKWSDMKKTASDSSLEMKNKVKSRLDDMKKDSGGVYDEMNTQFGKIKSLPDTLKGWKLPSIKMPHFKVKSGEAPYGLGGRGSLPSISVEWYAKAMNRAMILDGPTIFGSTGGSLLAGGEAGREVISGEAHLMDLIAKASNSQTDAAILNELKAMNDNMYPTMVKAFKAMSFRIGDRDFARMVNDV